MHAPPIHRSSSRGITFLREAVRPRYMLPLFALTCLIYALFLYPWMMNWGSTPAERDMTLPGDELISQPAAQFTRAITIDAPVDEVWPWLMQLGQDRAGFYSYTWLENLTGADIHNGTVIRPEWQSRVVGDPVRMAPAEVLGIRPGETTILRIVELDPGRSLMLAKWPAPYANVWATVLQPVDGNTTRLLVRERTAETPSLFTRAFYDPAHFVMQSHLMRGVEARAEGHPSPPEILSIPARVGWTLAALTVLGLFLMLGKHGAPWLLIPLAAALPALVLGRDLDAAIAAFLAVGITVLGALRFGRRWWAPFLNIAAAVMLILLLASDAYTVFGWTFLLLIVATVAALWIKGRHVAPWTGRRAHAAG